MADITKEQLQSLFRLSRIHCTDEEQDTLLQDLKKIIHYVEQLEEVDTEGVDPCYQVVPLSNIMREDEPREMLPREAFLANAPEQVGGMIKVPPVIHKK